MNSSRFPLALLAMTLLSVPMNGRAIDAAAFDHPLRVACVGDSITLGVGTHNPSEESYPARLQALLGKQWAVRNFGVGGRTLLRKVDPFDYNGALQFKPDVVILALGTNDARTDTWHGHQGEFIGDYVAMIKAFQALPNHPRVWACLPPPAFPGNYGITEEMLRDGVLPSIKKAAQLTGIKLIDLHSPLLGNKGWFPDAIHPNAAGTQRIAALVAAELAKK